MNTNDESEKVDSNDGTLKTTNPIAAVDDPSQQMEPEETEESILSKLFQAKDQLRRFEFTLLSVKSQMSLNATPESIMTESSSFAFHGKSLYDPPMDSELDSSAIVRLFNERKISRKRKRCRRDGLEFKSGSEIMSLDKVLRTGTNPNGSSVETATTSSSKQSQNGTFNNKKITTTPFFKSRLPGSTLTGRVIGHKLVTDSTLLTTCMMSTLRERSYTTIENLYSIVVNSLKITCNNDITTVNKIMENFEVAIAALCAIGIIRRSRQNSKSKNVTRVAKSTASLLSQNSKSNLVSHSQHTASSKTSISHNETKNAGDAVSNDKVLKHATIPSTNTTIANISCVVDNKLLEASYIAHDSTPNINTSDTNTGGISTTTDTNTTVSNVGIQSGTVVSGQMSNDTIPNQSLDVSNTIKKPETTSTTDTSAVIGNPVGGLSHPEDLIELNRHQDRILTNVRGYARRLIRLHGTHRNLQHDEENLIRELCNRVSSGTISASSLAIHGNIRQVPLLKRCLSLISEGNEERYKRKMLQSMSNSRRKSVANNSSNNIGHGGSGYTMSRAAFSPRTPGNSTGTHSSHVNRYSDTHSISNSYNNNNNNNNNNNMNVNSNQAYSVNCFESGKLPPHIRSNEVSTETTPITWESITDLVKDEKLEQLSLTTSVSSAMTIAGAKPKLESKSSQSKLKSNQPKSGNENKSLLNSNNSNSNTVNNDNNDSSNNNHPVARKSGIRALLPMAEVNIPGVRRLPLYNGNNNNNSYDSDILIDSSDLENTDDEEYERLHIEVMQSIKDRFARVSEENEKRKLLKSSSGTQPATNQQSLKKKKPNTNANHC